MNSSRNDTILITGASTGTGLALAKRLIKQDYRLVLTARESSLMRFKHINNTDLDLPAAPEI